MTMLVATVTQFQTIAMSLYLESAFPTNCAPLVCWFAEHTRIAARPIEDRVLSDKDVGQPGNKASRLNARLSLA